MLPTCRKRLMVAMAGVATFARLGAGLAVAQISQNAPAFARIVVSEKSVVYIQIQGGELRAAMSVEGLQKPPVSGPVKMRELISQKAVPPFEFALPVPADKLPAGIMAVKASLLIVSTPVGTAARHIFIGGELRLSRKDAHSEEWQYVSRVNTGTSEQLKDAPDIVFPDLGKLKATLDTKTSDGKLAIGLRLTAGFVELLDVRKDGQSVPVKVVVTDASSAQIASKVGTLADFGFS